MRGIVTGTGRRGAEERADVGGAGGVLFGALLRLARQLALQVRPEPPHCRRGRRAARALLQPGGARRGARPRRGATKLPYNCRTPAVELLTTAVGMQQTLRSLPPLLRRSARGGVRLRLRCTQTEARARGPQQARSRSRSDGGDRPGGHNAPMRPILRCAQASALRQMRASSPNAAASSCRMRCCAAACAARRARRLLRRGLHSGCGGACGRGRCACESCPCAAQRAAWRRGHEQASRREVGRAPWPYV